MGYYLVPVLACASASSQFLPHSHRPSSKRISLFCILTLACCFNKIRKASETHTRTASLGSQFDPSRGVTEMDRRTTESILCWRMEREERVDAEKLCECRVDELCSVILCLRLVGVGETSSVLHFGEAGRNSRNENEASG